MLSFHADNLSVASTDQVCAGRWWLGREGQNLVHVLRSECWGKKTWSLGWSSLSERDTLQKSPRGAAGGCLETGPHEGSRVDIPGQ